MKNLSYQVKEEKVIFKITVNTINYYSTSEFVSEKLCESIIENAYRSERIISEINEGNDMLFVEQIIVFDSEDRPLVCFEVNKGRRFREEERSVILEEIRASIKDQKPYTSVSLFEMRANDLEVVEYSYFIDDLEINHLYQYQIYSKKYLRV